jgi:hypothetical protein
MRLLMRVSTRVLWITLGILAVTQGVLSARCQLAMPAGQLVREVVYNELKDHERHGYWRYWVERRSPAGSRVEEQVETADGPIARLALSNGRPLTPKAQQQENDRLQHLLDSPDEQARHLKQYDEDEEGIGRILALLPDAFAYEYGGEENGCYRLRFQPNPGYAAHSIEARIFRAMSGTLWVNARAKRLARLEGRVDDNVDFGFGIFGRLYKGGWFRLVRSQVSATDWKTESLEVHMNIRALLVKTFARETSEVRGGFVPVPAGMHLAQGLALLNQSQVQAEVQPRSPSHAGVGSTLVAPAALAMRP